MCVYLEGGGLLCRAEPGAAHTRTHARMHACACTQDPEGRLMLDSPAEGVQAFLDGEGHRTERFEDPGSPGALLERTYVSGCVRYVLTCVLMRVRACGRAGALLERTYEWLRAPLRARCRACVRACVCMRVAARASRARSCVLTCVRACASVKRAQRLLQAGRRRHKSWAGEGACC